MTMTVSGVGCGNTGASAPSLEDAVRNRVRTAIADLLPEEQWAEIVRASIHKLLAREREQYGSRIQSSDLDKIVSAELQAQVKILVAADIAEHWVGKDGEIKAALAEAIERQSATALKDTLGSIMNGALQVAMGHARGGRF